MRRQTGRTGDDVETLDLHGIRHEDVERQVEDFILMNSTPVRIITGNSPMMKALVDGVVSSHGLYSQPESYWNLGSLVILEYCA